MVSNNFSCPLCKSSLSENRYYEIVGVWEEKKKAEAEFKRKLIDAEKLKLDLVKKTEEIKREKEILKKKFEEDKKQILVKQNNELIKKEQELKKKFEEDKKLAILKASKEVEQTQKNIYQKEIDKKSKEMKDILAKQKQTIAQATKIALIEGKEKMLKQQQNMHEQLENKVKSLTIAEQKIKELTEQIKKGTTPQLEGLNFEEELVHQLHHKFPTDKIEHHGKGGDILHYIIQEGKQVGIIVYECKKTQKFSKDYVKQIKKDVLGQTATYGVLVTFASEKGKNGFWVEEDILIVHPYGAIHLSGILRKSMIDLYVSGLGKAELGDMAKKVLEYLKGEKFKNSLKDIIFRAKELHEILNKEMAIHERIWEKRRKDYDFIAQDSELIERESSSILKEKEITK